MGVFLAPMAGVTDLPYRLLARKYGADLVVSEMISAQAIVYRNQRTLNMLAIHEEERPCAIQLFGHDPEVMAAAAALVFEQVQPDMIDLNFGCPTPKVVKNGDGAALLRDPDRLSRIAAAVVRAVPIPVTAKIRLGWDERSINCLEVVRRLEDAGVHWITVHARTREQFYSGKARWEYIAAIKANSRLPIVGNGDIYTPADAREMITQTSCDHIAIGRGAQGNPWIFQQVKAYLAAGELLPPPSLEERIGVALRHLEMKIEADGEERAVREMRPHLAWYLKGVPFSSAIRRELNTAENRQEMERLLKELL